MKKLLLVPLIIFLILNFNTNYWSDYSKLINPYLASYNIFKKNPNVPNIIIIPKIGIKTNIELVGQDQEGKMDVPKNINNVGWYKFGSLLGESGNIVMDGHLDSETGPGVFINLSNLEIGDEILVIDETSKVFKFVVYDKKSFQFNQVPMEELFKSQEKQDLILITCGGVFDLENKNYLERVVIFAQETV